jgi:hypothetical protein
MHADSAKISVEHSATYHTLCKNSQCVSKKLAFLVDSMEIAESVNIEILFGKFHYFSGGNFISCPSSSKAALVLAARSSGVREENRRSDSFARKLPVLSGNVASKNVREILKCCHYCCQN